MVKVGEIDGCDVEYDEKTYEFSVTISGQVFRSTSFPRLKQLVDKSKELKWEKVMYMGYEASQPPRTVEVTLRGNKYYEMVEGKLRPAETYYLYEFDQKVFDRLTAIAVRIRKLKGEWSEVKSKIKHSY